MPRYPLPYFGEINTEDLDGYYDIDIKINNNDVPVNLTFDDTMIENQQLDIVKTYIEKLDHLDRQNINYIINDFNNEKGDTVRYYLQYHLDNIGKEHLSELVNTNSGTSEPEQLLKRMHLVKVAIYPHEEDYLAIFDYSIGQHLTNHLVVISTDKDGNLHHMAMES